MAISLSRVIQFLPQNYFWGIYIVETKTLSSCDVLNPLIINNDNIFALISPAPCSSVSTPSTHIHATRLEINEY